MIYRIFQKFWDEKYLQNNEFSEEMFLIKVVRFQEIDLMVFDYSNAFSTS